MYNLALSFSYYARIVNILCGNCVNNHCMNFRQLRSFSSLEPYVETFKCIVAIHRAMSRYIILNYSRYFIYSI